MMRARRRAAVAPLFAWLEEHHHRVSSVLARAAERAGAPPMSRGRITQIKQGILPVPTWMVEQTCHELEQPIGRVMGGGWLAEYGAEYAAETYARWHASMGKAAS